MKHLSFLGGPTLARRVVLTLLPAFALIWIVLIAYYYIRETDQEATNIQQQNRGEIVTAALAKIENVEQARNAIALYLDFLNSSLRRTGQPVQFLLQLEDRQGHRLFMSTKGSSSSLRGVTGKIVGMNVDGKRYRIFRGDTTRWAVLLAEPQLDDAWLLARLSSNLTMSLLLSLPFVLLPTWFAVARGLRPLRRLSSLISARGPDDLAPLGFHAKYGELMPVTAALDRMLSQLRLKMAREYAFVQDAAHELRTPMAVISAQAHVLSMATDSDARCLAGQQLDSAIARTSHLIQQLLDLAHVDRTELPQAHESDVALLIRQELAIAAPAAMLRNIDLSFDSPDALLCTLELHAFQSILQNLLANALRYGHDGGHVVVTLGAHQGKLTLSVADDGPGISEDESALVFERFYRVAGNDLPGSGLGLAIVAQAVVRLRGTVRLTSGLEGRGCEFIVELPLR